jgi:hypothetical protein
LLKDGVPGFVSLVIVGAGVYLASWIPYLLTTGGYGRQWGAQNPDDPVVRRLGEALGSLWHYHVETYRFHTGEQMANATHTYASSPWGWPVVARTVGVYAENDIAPGVQGCTAPAGETCMRVITALGTPLLWWAATVALLAGLVWWLAGRDWRFGVVVLGFASTWLPWVISNRGAMFSFYAITMIPFMAIGLAMALGILLGPARPGVRRQTGAVLVGTLVALSVLNFAFMYPLYTGQLLTHRQWLWRIWLPGWSGAGLPGWSPHPRFASDCTASEAKNPTQTRQFPANRWDGAGDSKPGAGLRAQPSHSWWTHPPSEPVVSRVAAGQG